ncbi:hypothetical protein GOODEAATRI_028348 [Goodea atripinnis]|uniref:Uncharacterized protein n=1 Tax=Goodea atripinnis TaxID=208336 RepID=A0ABV0N4Y5_9TELE
MRLSGPVPTREKSAEFPQFGERPPGGARKAHVPQDYLGLTDFITAYWADFHKCCSGGRTERENIDLVSVGRFCWKRRGGKGGPLAHLTPPNSTMLCPIWPKLTPLHPIESLYQCVKAQMPSTFH